MKKFRDVKVGDTIYYYTHCKMIPQIVHKIEHIDETEHVNNYGYGYDRKVNHMIIQAGKAKERKVMWASDNTAAEWGSTLHFADRESAESHIKSLKYTANCFIDEANRNLNKYTKLKSKYDIAFD